MTVADGLAGLPRCRPASPVTPQPVMWSLHHHFIIQSTSALDRQRRPGAHDSPTRSSALSPRTATGEQSKSTPPGTVRPSSARPRHDQHPAIGAGRRSMHHSGGEVSGAGNASTPARDIRPCCGRAQTRKLAPEDARETSMRSSCGPRTAVGDR